MQKGKNIKVGIGFATGRKSFQKVLRTYILNISLKLTSPTDITVAIYHLFPIWNLMTL